MTVSLGSLLIQETKDVIYATALGIATAIGVPTSTWQPGDPTRSLFYLEAEELSELEVVVANFIASGFLDYATGPWLVILAQQVFNVIVPDATYASTTLTLTNAGGGVYDINAGDLTFKSSLSGKTFHNTAGGHLDGSGGTLSFNVTADEAGSASSAGAGEIDTLVTTLLGVTCTNALAAVGTDQQSEDVTRQQCRDKLGSLSPNGPKEAYSFVARTPALAGTNAVLRVRTYPDSDNGQVPIYLATASGGVLDADRALVEAGIAQWATPLCISPIVAAASNVAVPVTYTAYVYSSVNQTSTQIQAAIESALEAFFAAQQIGGDIIPPATTGNLYVLGIQSAIKDTFPQIFRVDVTAPAGDTALTNGQVATLGTITPTITFVANP